MIMNDYKIVEHKFNEAILLVKIFLNDTCIESVSSDIYAGEWNLALETLCAILYQEKVLIPSKLYSLLQEIGSILAMESSIWQWLEQQVSDSDETLTSDDTLTTTPEARNFEICKEN